MMNEYGRQVPWTSGRTLYEVQRQVGHDIEREIVDLLTQRDNMPDSWKTKLQTDPTQLPLFIKERIEEEYSQ